MKKETVQGKLLTIPMSLLLVIALYLQHDCFRGVGPEELQEEGSL